MFLKVTSRFIRNLSVSLALLSICACRDAQTLPILFADKPPLATVRMLEARLAREPCVGSLERWSRRYHYRAPQGRLDKHAIVIHLTEAGHDGPAGVSIEPVYAILEIDHRPIRTAFGIYDDRRNVIRYWYCGSNIGGNGRPSFRDLPM